MYILGRIDDVINISGHRLSTIEIESALVTHPAVVEAGVCPVEDDLTGLPGGRLRDAHRRG